MIKYYVLFRHNLSLGVRQSNNKIINVSESQSRMHDISLDNSIRNAQRERMPGLVNGRCPCEKHTLHTPFNKKKCLFNHEQSVYESFIQVAIWPPYIPETNFSFHEVEEKREFPHCATSRTTKNIHSNDIDKAWNGWNFMKLISYRRRRFQIYLSFAKWLDM